MMRCLVSVQCLIATKTKNKTTAATSYKNKTTETKNKTTAATSHKNSNHLIILILVHYET